MPNKLKTLGIIPARGGSKGIPRKNIRNICGKPLIEYSISSAKESNKLTHFVVSTEDAEIAEISKKLGAHVINRSAEIANDDTPMLPVIQDAVRREEKRLGLKYDVVLILQPTTPMRTGEDIDSAITLLVNSRADSVVSVYKVSDAHPARMYKITDKKLTPFAPEIADVRRQELPPVYHRNGAIYCFKRDLVMEQETFFGDDIRPLVMDAEVSVNIDEEMDLLIAELVIAKRNKNNDQNPE